MPGSYPERKLERRHPCAAKRRRPATSMRTAGRTIRTALRRCWRADGPQSGLMMQPSKSASTRFPSTLVAFWRGQDITQQAEQSRQKRVLRLTWCELPQVHVHVHSRSLQCPRVSPHEETNDDFLKDSGSCLLIPSMSEFPSREHSEQLELRRARRSMNAVYAIAQRCDAAARFVALEATDERAFESEKEEALGTSGGTPKVTGGRLMARVNARLPCLR
jgi:hypothetical protein